MLQSKDLEQLQTQGISPCQLEEELQAFRQGFPFLKLAGAAKPGNGITVFDDSEIDSLCQAWDDYANGKHKIVKFVPASGAASRMFKNLFAFVGADHDEPTTDFEKTFFAHIDSFAFHDQLDATCQQLYGTNISGLIAVKRHKEVVKALLHTSGMNYGQMPKGLLKFHSYENGARTPVEEHLVEGALYAKDYTGTAHLHFTVSADSQDQFEDLLKAKLPQAETSLHTKFEITMSQQKPSTDTVAVTLDNEIFRTADGLMLFRPGGHGSLIENLSDIDADIVFIKNIDNVVPDRLKADTVRYKKLIAGYLTVLQQKTFNYLHQLDAAKPSAVLLDEIKQFLEHHFCIKGLSATADQLRCKLNRPMRVCAMVKNVGEPGGGPFLAYNPDGTASLQILESNQIDMSDAASAEMFNNGTHFNPVDIVCAFKGYDGKPFDLKQYVDKSTGFISHKSKDGRELKALERPGLWNGAMSDWLTAFVDVPLTTFNPVKTINDLLRPEHQ